MGKRAGILWGIPSLRTVPGWVGSGELREVGVLGRWPSWGDTNANVPHAALLLEASQLGPIKGRRDEGHPTARRQDRLEPGIPFPWKLRTRGSYGLPRLCPPGSFVPSQLLG